MLTALHRAAALATILAAGTTSAAWAQATTADPHHPEEATETMPSAEPGATAEQGQGRQPGQPGMMGQEMMGHGMMGPGMRKHGHMMKVMFAIADTDGDGALSFEEITEIHRRIFQAVDADQDGSVTPEEVQAFMGG